ncbi:MAG: sugar kinase [Ruminococcaceae bacterium]|nr:sugar kinase [Oscillospiraceae bacterium]
MMKKIITFGEIMVRLQTPGYKRFKQAQTLEMTFGGGEANVAVSLAGYGMHASFVTKLPSNAVADACVAEFKKYDVDTTNIVRGGDRIGVYYVEKGASQRASTVLYDRANSAIATASSSDFDWAKIFEGADWFHFTGITPALSDECAAITLEACKAAKAAGVQVSCDLNFRKKLWTSEKAGQVMSGLMEYVDVLIANEEDAEKVFGIKASGTDITSGQISDEGYQDVAKQLVAKFGVKKVAITLRESISASINNWAAMLYDGKDFYKSKKYTINIVDRVGGGDSFGGGLIYALLSDYSMQDTIEFAVAASCLKHTIEGDFNLMSVDEVKALAGGDGSGRVQR